MIKKRRQQNETVISVKLVTAKGLTMEFFLSKGVSAKGVSAKGTTREFVLSKGVSAGGYRGHKLKHVD